MVVGSPKTGVSLGLPAKSIGAFPNETASIAYDGTLLPAGTAKYGSELVVNGGFDTDTAWTKGTEWAISGGVANVANVGVVTYLIPSPILSSIVGKTYLITFTVSNYVAGTVRFSYGGINGTAITANGTYTEIVTAISVNTFSLYAGTTASCSFDNVSVKEVLINPNYRYHKNLGVLKSEGDALSEAGQGKAFNGSNQHINTGIIPNPAQGTLVTRFTYASGAVSRWVYGSSEIGIWINASGKVECVFGNATYTITDTLVAGRSYHIEMPYLGLSANVILDGVTKGTATATVFNPTLPMYVGARNASGTADRFFNSVIDETYYYDIALTDAQISTLYQYPEKIKAYNGGIVPDIGNEDNCKLFLPMSESLNTAKHNTVVNVAIPYSSELLPSGKFDSSASWGTGTGWVISNGVATHTGVTASALSYPFVPTVDKYYNIEVIVSALSGAVCYSAFTGGTLVSGNGLTLGTNNIIIKALTGNINFYLGMSTNGDITVDNVSIKEVSAFPIANFTASCVDSAKQLSYGAQCIAWKRDALGLPIGMSGGLAFDGWKSAKPPVVYAANTITDTTPVVMEAIIYCNTTGDFKFAMGSNFLRLGIDGNGEPWARAGTYQTSITPTPTTTIKNAYHHVVAQSTGSAVNAWVDGVQYKTNVNFASSGVDGVPFVLGTSGWNKPLLTIAGTAKIHKGTQYTKFDIAKSYAKAQKIIAKLGA